MDRGANPHEPADAEPRISQSQLAERAGVTEADVDRLVRLGILVPRNSSAAFLAGDRHKVRLAKACEEAGLPMDGIGSAIRDGRLSFAFLEAPPFERWAEDSDRSYRSVSDELAVPFDVLQGALEAIGFAPAPSADDRILDVELEVIPLLRLGLSSGMLDEASIKRVGRAYVQGLRIIAKAENEVYHARFEVPMFQSGVDRRKAMELAAQEAANYTALVDRMLMAAYRRQQELAWVEHLVEHVEAELDVALPQQPDRVPAMCFLDLVGYARLTESSGDEVAVELASTLARLVDRLAGQHRGSPVKWGTPRVPVGELEPPARLGTIPEQGT